MPFDWKGKTVNTHQYDHEDFLLNMRKYTLFRTASIVEQIKSRPELPVGTMVHVQYYCLRNNAAFGNVEMPVYKVWTDNNEDLKKSPALLFARVLGDFVL